MAEIIYVWLMVVQLTHFNSEETFNFHTKVYDTKKDCVYDAEMKANQMQASMNLGEADKDLKELKTYCVRFKLEPEQESSTEKEEEKTKQPQL